MTENIVTNTRRKLFRVVAPTGRGIATKRQLPLGADRSHHCFVKGVGEAFQLVAQTREVARAHPDQLFLPAIICGTSLATVMLRSLAWR